MRRFQFSCCSPLHTSRIVSQTQLEHCLTNVLYDIRKFYRITNASSTSSHRRKLFELYCLTDASHRLTDASSCIVSQMLVHSNCIVSHTSNCIVSQTQALELFRLTHASHRLTDATSCIVSQMLVHSNCIVSHIELHRLTDASSCIVFVHSNCIVSQTQALELHRLTDASSRTVSSHRR